MFSVTSPGFVAFVAVLLALWYHAPARRRAGLLLAAGLLFDLVLAGPWGVVLLLGACTAVWWAARQLGGAHRRIWLAVGLGAALGPLLVLKYTGMLWAPAQGWWQPLGLAYYSLQLVSYLVDVWHGQPAEPRPERVWCFASFFLSMTQGPFNRYHRLMPQLETACPHRADFVQGMQRSAWGYFKKYAIAERCAVVVNAVFAQPLAYDRSQILLAMVLFAFQLYADFSAYTDIVLGVGQAMGLTLPENFRQPFLAATTQELWARWHISFSQWLRDYVYIPLGGNRKGRARKDLNLLLTFAVSGLWHGAGLTYLVWGALFGLYQALENHLPWRGKLRRGVPRAVGIAGTFALFVATFTIFRATSLQNAGQMFYGLLHNAGHAALSNYWSLGLTSRLEQLLLFAGVALLVLVDVLHENGVHLRQRLAARPWPVRLLVYEAALIAFLFMGRFMGGGGFLYARY